MRLRKPIKRWKVIVSTILLIIMLFVVQSFVFIEYNLQPVFISVAENYARKIATEAVNDAITKKVAEETDYKRIVEFIKDDKGTIRSAVFNMVEANRIKAQTTNRVQSVLKDVGEREIELPIGQSLHSTILATFGPRVPIKIIPFGTAKSDIVQESKTVGINQTEFSLTLKMHTQVNIIIPFVTKPVELDTQVPIASFVMVGEVPQVFFDSNGTPFYPPGFPMYQSPAPNPSK
jgi:sporulation protein YunB